MMVFGRKCPTCGGRSLIARQPDSWLAVLAPVRSCADCHRRLVALPFLSIGVEQRQFPRKGLPPFFLVRLPDANRYARVKNISEGGLCFNLDYAAAPISQRFLSVDLYNCNDGSSLDRLSAEIVATTEQLLESNGFKTTVFNICARFVNLNQAQRKVLLTCLGQHGMELL